MSQIRTVVLLLLGIAVLPGVMSAQYRGDAGQYVIVAAQYGTAAHHSDVTNRLRDLARTDRSFTVSNNLFGGDPDPGHPKTLRIYARGANGQNRMFEYPENGTVNGAQFTNWQSGQWDSGGYNGRWEGDNDADDRRGGYRAGLPGGHAEAQPEMTQALQELREAQSHLQQGAHDKGGHRQRALDLVNQAISETQQGINYDNTH